MIFNTKSEENNLKEELKVLSPAQGLPINVELVGITHRNPSYVITRKKAKMFVIEYVISGAGYVFYDGEMHRVEADTVYILYAGDDHRYYADTHAPFEKIFMNIRGDFCFDILSAYNLSGKHLFSGGRLRADFEKILSVIHSDISEGEMQSLLQGIFIKIISALSSGESASRYSTEGLKMKEYLDSNTASIVSADELSKYIFRSPDYCLKLFKREFGVTPYSYQINRKMQVAKALLANTTMSVGEISASLGYADVHYFSNLFYSKCGQRPLSYRKQKKNIE